MKSARRRAHRPGGGPPHLCQRPSCLRSSSAPRRYRGSLGLRFKNKGYHTTAACRCLGIVRGDEASGALKRPSRMCAVHKQAHLCSFSRLLHWHHLRLSSGLSTCGLPPCCCSSHSACVFCPGYSRAHAHSNTETRSEGVQCSGPPVDQGVQVWCTFDCVRMADRGRVSPCGFYVKEANGIYC